MIFSFLPEDVIHHILSYNDRIKLRNGKYMNQLSNERKKIFIRPIRQSQLYIYEVIIGYHVYDCVGYRTNTCFFVDLENDTIIYTFCYDVDEAPEKYNLWIRN